VAADLSMAGLRLNPTAFLTLRVVVMVALPVLASGYVLSTGASDPIAWVALLLALLWGRKMPAMWLKRRIRARQREIDRRLPYSLDLMVACLEGGLSLDATLVKVVEQSEGPLATEIRKTLQELALGRPSGEAIRDLGERTGAPDLKRLCEDIVQADRMGVSIAQSLRTLARESRILRRQQAEEMARKAPIKMVPVLIFCVLPALGIVTTAPAAILLLRTFAQAR
jgi:tight adherence protein C